MVPWGPSTAMAYIVMAYIVMAYKVTAWQNGAVVPWGPSTAMLNHDFTDRFLVIDDISQCLICQWP